MATINGSTPDLSFLTKKYEEEKTKRLRQDGNAQYIDLESSSSSKLSRVAEDPWVDHDTLNAQAPNLKDGDDIKFLILGAGFSGLLFASRFVDAGFRAEDIRLVDTAGGFGGTWYWNRYPGLMCDSESSIYLPLLEKTGYRPKHRYSYGDEIRQYAEHIAVTWRLADKGVFRTRINSLVWDKNRSRWIITMTQSRGPSEASVDMTVTAQFVTLASGIFNHPKASGMDGLNSFEGDIVHTARWNYDVSGGSPTDPVLSGLRGKKVGIIGTGATGVQCATQLAKFAEHLYVFQRTPSAVDDRGQREISDEDWAETTSTPGWWDRRNANFAGILSGEQPEENLVNDGWTTLKSYKVVVSGPHKPIGLADIPSHIETVIAADAPRGDRLRQRVADTVTKDVDTAARLQAWYPAWCKRPCFHDDYLPTFNRPNVTLVQTEPQGASQATRKGLVVDQKEYDLDVLVLATGYRAPGADGGDPSKNAQARIIGRDGVDISDKWATEGPGSLHGLTTHGFPNLFRTGPGQAAASASITYVFDLMARHAAYIVAETTRRYNGDPDKLVIEPTKDAEEAWVAELVAGATFLSPISICLPSYINNEGAALKPETMAKAARGMTYPQGVNAFARRLEEWREQGDMQGLVISGPDLSEGPAVGRLGG